MEATAAEDLRYPVGRFEAKPSLAPGERSEAIRTLDEAPARMREAVAGLDDGQLDTSYRDGGWSVRQVVHHVADSHLNGYVRMRWALTEDEPTMKPYDRAAWAELPDARSGPVDLSLDLMDAVHRRSVALIRSLRGDDFRRRVLHPDGTELTVDALLQLYAWHSRHHTAHVTRLRERKGW